MKLFLVTRTDLPSEAQAVQCAHAALELGRKLVIPAGETLVLLGVQNELELSLIEGKART